MSTLPLYWKLSSPADEERLSASIDLVSSIERFQIDHTATSESAAPVNPDPPTEGWATHINAATSEDTKYALRRLTRGLASPNESSRLGFAVALTALLERIPTITAAQVIFLVNEASEITSSIRGQLLRDMLFARLFGLNCIAEAGLLFKTAPLPNTSTPPATIQAFLSVLTDFIWLGEQKTWLREPAWWSVVTVLKGLAESDVPWKNEAVDQVVSLIFKDPREWSAEKLAVAIQMQHDFPTVDWRKVLSPTFENGQILAYSSLPLVALALHDMPTDENDEAGLKPAVRADWKPQPHFAWDIVVKEYFQQDKTSASDKQQKSSVHDFFRVVVDDSLFGPNSTPERRFWGFQIFRKLLTSVPVADLPQLLTKNFMRTWTGHLSSKDKTLHKAARQVADDIKNAVEKDQGAGFGLIMALLGGTDGQFDRLTNSKTVESILGTMDAAGVQAYVDHLMNQAYGPDASTSDINSEQGTLNSKRLWAIEQLSATLQSAVIPRDDAWISVVFQFLLLHGFFAVKKKNNRSSVGILHKSLQVPFSAAARTACRQQTYACLVYLSSAHGKGRPGETSASPAAPDKISWASKVIDLLTVLELDRKHASLLREDSVGVVSLRKQARVVLKGIPDDGDRLKKGLKVLLEVFLLRSYDESFDALESFEEIIQAASDLLNSNHSGQKRNNIEDAEEAPEPIDVIVDSLIGDLEKGSSYERDTANIVFDFICGVLKNSTMDLLLTQLTPRNPLPEDDGSEADGSDIEVEETEKNGDSLDSTSSSTSSTDEVEDGDTSDDEVDPELRKRIAQALQVDEVHENGNGVDDLDDPSDSDNDEPMMDDEQMMALDDKLAEIFKSARGTKSELKGAQRQATIFKTRVVDFIETYIKRNPSSDQVPQILKSLLEMVTRSSSDEEQLKQKAAKVIRSGIGQIKEFIVNLDQSSVAVALKEVHIMASQTQNPDVTPVLMSACRYLVRNLLHAGADQLVSDVYMSSLDDAFTKKRSTFPVKVLDDFFRNHPGCAWTLRGRLVELCKTGSGISSRRQVQAVGLIRELLQGSTSEQIHEFIPSFVPSVSGILEAQGDPNPASSMTTPELRDVSQSLLTIVKRTTSNASSSEIALSLWNSEGKLGSAIAKLQGTPRAKSSTPLRRTLGALMELIGATDSSPSKKNSKKRRNDDNTSDVHGDGGEPTKVKKKQKKIET